MIAAVLAAFSIPDAAYGQMICGERDKFLKHLGDGYKEAPSARGLSGTHGAANFEILSSPDGRTWTALLTLPSGKSCVVASGTDWETFEPVTVTGQKT